MAITKVGTVATAGASASVASLSATVGVAGVAAGHHVTVQAVIQNSHTVSSVVDSKGNTYVVHKVRASTGGNPTVMLASAYVTTPLVSGDTITVNWDSAGFCAMLATEWAGGDSTGWFDTSSVGADATGTSAMTVGSLTTSVSDTLVVAAFGLTGAWNISTPGAGYTVGGSTAASTGTVRTADYEYRLDARAAGVETPTATASGNNNWVGIAVAFKPAAGGGTSATVTAVPLAASGDLVAPVVTGSSPGSVTAAPMLATGGMVAPLASAGAAVSAVPMAAVGDIPIAGGAFSSEIMAVPMAATGAVPAPSVSAAASGSVTAAPLASTGDVSAPTVLASAGITAVPLAAVGDLMAATVLASSLVPSAVLVGVGGLAAPGWSGGSVPPPDRIAWRSAPRAAVLSTSGQRAATISDTGDRSATFHTTGDRD